MAATTKNTIPHAGGTPHRNVGPTKFRITRILLLQIVTMSVAVFTFMWFRSENNRRIIQQNENYIEDCTVQETKQFEQNMDDALALIINAANQYATLTSLQANMTVLEKLETIHDNNLFSRIAYVSPDGVDINTLGTVDVSDRTYFQRGMQGETGWEKVESRLTREEVLAFYSPICVDGEITGVMVGLYDGDKIQNLFSSELFHYTPHTYLFQKDGTILISSNGSSKSGNLLQGFSQETFGSQVSYEDVLAFIDDPARKSISFSYGYPSHIVECAIAKASGNDWMLLSVLPNTVTNGMVSAVNQTGSILAAILVLAFLSNITATLLSSYGQQKTLRKAVDTATRDLQQTLEQELRQQSIIKSLSGIYSSVYYFSLPRLEYKLLQHKKDSACEDYSVLVPVEGKMADAVKLYVERAVLPTSSEAVSQFLDPDTILHRLAETDAVSLEYQRKDSNWCRGTIVVSERDEDGNPLSAVFAIQNIQGEKEKELKTQAALQDAYAAAQMASRAKTAFLSNMSHDMRTPMNAIIGMTAIAGSHLDNKERVEECLAKITASSKHLLSLINEVLDLSKIESGKVDLAEEEFSLSDLVDNMLTLNHSLIARHNHTLDVKLRSVVHENVIGDSIRLQQVFTNLLSNAAKYTPDNGYIKVELTEKESRSANIGWFEITFEDNGMGMSEEFQERIFEPFSREGTRQVSKIQGTGLGMPIARNIIRVMNGDITVESELGKGTKFTVTFCLKLQNEAALPDESFSNLSILIADDDPVSCESTCDMLDSLGMNSEWVLSGEEAVEKVSRRHDANDDYYAVILDWRMPGIGGAGAARAIREKVGEDMPIIIVSAYDWADIEEEASAAGVNTFIAKPLFKSRMIQLFKELLGHAAEPTVRTLQDTMEKLDFTGKRVLLVEDNELNAEIASELLDMAKLSVETAENGKSAVEKVSSSAPGYYDLIFMDIQMPVMDGYEATRAIRALNRSDARTLPIVAMTANAFTSDIQDAKDAGMNDHIAKPVDLDYLTRILCKYLKPVM